MSKKLLAVLLWLAMPLIAVAQVWTVESGETLVVNAFGQRVLTVEMRPDSASQVLTFTGNSVDGDTYTIAATVYTTETGTVDTAFEVNDAATAALFIVNLCAAINADGVGDGSDDAAGTTAHPTVTCSASTATTLTVTAIVPGSGANTIATTETTAISSWGAATLADVTDPVCITGRVDTASATEHTYFTTTTTATTPDYDVFDVEGPFYLITAASGDCIVEVVP